MAGYQVITVWQAHGDGGERGLGPVIAVCSTEDQARAAAEGKGWYGGNGFVQSAQALRTTDGATWLLARGTPVDMDNDQKRRDATAREALLQRLTPEEKRLLGIVPKP